MILAVDLCYKKNSLSYDEFVMPIVKIIGKCTVKHYTELRKNDIELADKIVLCGTALKDSRYLNNVKRFKWLERINKPVLGICAGMLVIGVVFGCTINKSEEIGMTNVKLRTKNKLVSSNIKAYELHSYSLDNLKNFDVLAYSSKCVQVVKHKKKPFYGIMFHPEVRNEQLIKNFLLLT